MSIKQKILKRKYEKCNKYIYIVCQWAKWGVIKEKWTGKVNENGEPLIIKYNDHNGEYDSYYTCCWFNATSGITIAYYFNKNKAEKLCQLLNSEVRI